MLTRPFNKIDHSAHRYTNTESFRKAWGNMTFFHMALGAFVICDGQIRVRHEMPGCKIELLTMTSDRMNRCPINSGRANTDRLCITRGNVTLLDLALCTPSSCVVGQNKAF